MSYDILQVYDKNQRWRVSVRKGFYKVMHQRFAVQIPKNCVWFKAWNSGKFPGLFD
jgi:hypothetical protein